MCDVSRMTCRINGDQVTHVNYDAVSSKARQNIDMSKQTEQSVLSITIRGFSWTGSGQKYLFLFCIESAVIELEVRKTFRLNRRVLSLALVCIPQDRELKPATFAGLLKNKAYRKVMISYFRYFMTEVRGTALRV